MGINDIITLSDERKYIVTNLKKYKGVTYYLIIDIDEVTKYKIVYESGLDELSELEDQNLLSRVILLMTKDVIK